MLTEGAKINGLRKRTLPCWRVYQALRKFDMPPPRGIPFTIIIIIIMITIIIAIAKEGMCLDNRGTLSPANMGLLLQAPPSTHAVFQKGNVQAVPRL